MERDSCSRIFWVDCVRAFAIVCVVLLHCAAPYLYLFKKLPFSYWMIANLYDSFARIGVPLFFMISGQLSLGAKYDLENFLKRRFKRVFLPLIGWSVFFVFWRYFYEHSLQLSMKTFLSLFLQPVYYHLWFIYSILGLYLAAPVLKMLLFDGKLLAYYLIVWFLAVAIIPFLKFFLAVSSFYELHFFMLHTGYFLLGYSLGEGKLVFPLRFRSFSLWCIFLLSTLVTFLGTSVLSHLSGKFVELLYSYTSLSVIPASCSAYLLLKKYAIRLKKFESLVPVIEKLAKYSFGIYFVHVVYLTLLNDKVFGFRLNGLTWHPVAGIPATMALTLLLSFWSVSLLRRLPLMKNFV